VAYFPYVTLLSVISFNDVTIPAFSTLLNELNASLPQCCLELWRWQAGWFVLLNDEQVKEFSESFDNENPKKKTLYDLKVFKEFLDTCDEKRIKMGNFRYLSPYNKKNITRWLEDGILCSRGKLNIEHKIHIFSPPINILYF